MIEVQNIAAGYGRLTAVKKVSLHVNAGEIVTVVGPNGAGKSTLLRCMMGLLPANSGKVTFEGVDITKLSTSQIVKLGLTLVPESRDLFPGLSVTDNLLLGAYVHRGENDADKKRQAAMSEVFELFPALKERATVPAASLSGGQQQMVAIGRALMTRPKALLLDEPSLGIAPLVIRMIFNAVSQLRARGMAILLVEQNVRMALRLAERAYVLETGNIVAETRAGDAEATKAIIKAYFGTSKSVETAPA